MHSRLVVLVASVVAAVSLAAAPASADEPAPLWPCTVTMSIQDGPWRAAAARAVRQLDEATVTSWRIIESGAMVTIGWADLDAPIAALSTVGANDQVKTGGSVQVDPDVSKRWLMYTLLHELGHVAGLDHNEEPQSVMGGGDVPYRRYTSYDLRLLGDLRCG